ncbi:hypothetical protein DFH07DRAFT_958003 [Mycena maculata]|uniref:Uncharacterized protein n=1 Tax=Mycena maculata TaxID=230809 RepID=A0AAD7J8B5_9AGAR|nr:hypothetical protein DFH07DRAFT_958003 [Mycena maculata]
MTNTRRSRSPPPRQQKTHISVAVIAALKALSGDAKRRKNTQILDRNAERNFQRTLHASQPSLADASDDESLITVSDVADSPATTFWNTIHHLSPKSAKTLIRGWGPFSSREKRPREEESEERSAAKRIREEIVLHPGMSLPVSFHPLLHELHSFGVYIPLSLFTPSNLELITSSAVTLVTRKLNPLVQGHKHLDVLDTAAFESTLPHGEWLRASRNYVLFIETAAGLDSHEARRWHQHFGHLDSVEDGVTHHPAVLATDIRLRKRYSTTPFQFDAAFYAHEFDSAKHTLALKNLDEKWNSSTSSGHGRVSGAGGSGGAGPSNSNNSNGGGGAGAGRSGTPPFQQGNGGDASAAACLICA